MYAPSLIQYGQPEPLPEPRMLRAGPLTMRYEHGFLRYIRLGNHEVLRLIYHAVRDPNWATAPMVIEDETIDQQADSFHIRYTSVCQNETVHLRWKCEIIGEPDGTIQFNIDGEALAGEQHSVMLKGSTLAAGTYTYRVVANGKTKTNRVVLDK